MRSAFGIIPTATGLLLGGVAFVFLAAQAGAAAEFEFEQAAAAPRFSYASGAQGTRYYPQAQRPAARPAQAASNRGSSVGPGVRDWSTGRKGRLHKPWMSGR